MTRQGIRTIMDHDFAYHNLLRAMTSACDNYYKLMWNTCYKRQDICNKQIIPCDYWGKIQDLVDQHHQSVWKSVHGFQILSVMSCSWKDNWLADFIKTQGTFKWCSWHCRPACGMGLSGATMLIHEENRRYSYSWNVSPIWQILYSGNFSLVQISRNSFQTLQKKFLWFLLNATIYWEAGMRLQVYSVKFGRIAKRS